MENAIPAKLPKGQRVMVHSNKSDWDNRTSANGHICRIEWAEVSSVPRTGYWKYVLHWEQSDNPGKKFPKAVNQYYFMENEIAVLTAPFPSPATVKKDSLPDI